MSSLRGAQRSRKISMRFFDSPSAREAMTGAFVGGGVLDAPKKFAASMDANFSLHKAFRTVREAGPYNWGRWCEKPSP